MKNKKLYKIDVDNKYDVSKKIVNFLNPEYACVLLNYFDNLEGLKKINKSKLVDSNDLNSFSPISGEVSGIVTININGKDKKALFIKNDFKEKDTKYKNVTPKNSADLVNLFVGTKYYSLLNKLNATNIVINGVTDEPFVYTEEYILKNLSDQIIETIDFLGGLFNFSNSYIVLKNTDSSGISEFLSKSGTYPNMNIVLFENLYLLGKNDFLLDKMNLCEKNSIVLKPSEILEIRNFIKYSAFKSEKYICVIEEKNNKIRIMNVKKNILLSEVLNKLKLLDFGFDFYKNGLINGTLINPNKEIISSDLDAIFVMKKVNNVSSKCIKCGKCIQVCPYKVDRFTGQNIKKCIKCGLCNYFCPSKIEFESRGKEK